jgi:cytochrome b6
VGTDITGALPVVGPFMMRFLRGGDQITGGTLTRFFGFHVAVLPALTTAILATHVYLVQRHGMSVPPGVERSRSQRTIRFMPNFLLRDMVGWLAALAMLALLAALFPWELGVKADPYAAAPAGIRPEWYFGWMFQTLRMIPSHVLGMEGELVGILGIGVAAVLWVAAPFLDDPRGSGSRARLWTIFGVIALIYIVSFTLLVYRPVKP